MRTTSLWVASLAAMAIVMYLGESAHACVQCFDAMGSPACASGYSEGFLLCHVDDQKCTPIGECFVTGCFVAGTLVETAEGPRVLEDVQVGDMVLGVDENGRYVLNEVVETIRSIAHSYVVINGTIEVTETHPFAVGNQWVPAGELHVGDMIAGADGIGVPVESIRTVDRGVRAFNLTVAGNHTFFAEGVLVHNKSGDPNDP